MTWTASNEYIPAGCHKGRSFLIAVGKGKGDGRGRVAIFNFVHQPVDALFAGIKINKTLIISDENEDHQANGDDDSQPGRGDHQIGTISRNRLRKAVFR